MLQERWENLHGMQLYHREFSLSLTLVPIASKHDATWPNYGHNFQAYEPSLIVPPPPSFLSLSLCQVNLNPTGTWRETIVKRNLSFTVPRRSRRDCDRCTVIHTIVYRYVMYSQNLMDKLYPSTHSSIHANMDNRINNLWQLYSKWEIDRISDEVCTNRGRMWHDLSHNWSSFT